MHESLISRHAPGVIRTHNLLIRSQMLYPVELRVRTGWEGYFQGYESQAGGSGFLKPPSFFAPAFFIQNDVQGGPGGSRYPIHGAAQIRREESRY